MRNLQRRKYKQSEITQEIKDIFAYYDSYRQQFEERAIENYKKFIGYLEEAEEGRSNLHIPKTFEILDTIRARFLSSFFDQRPYIEFTTMPEAGDIRSMLTGEDKAEVAASFVDEQLEKNDVRTVYSDFVTSMLIFPAAFLSVGWRYEQADIKRKTKAPVVDRFGSYTGEWKWDIVESTETIWDDNEIANVDFFDFWGDPDNPDLDDARAVFHREFITIGELENKLKLLEKVGDGIVYPVNISDINAYSRQEDRGRNRRLSAVGITSFGNDPFKNSNSKEMNDKQQVEILHYWEDDRHTMLLNRNTVIYDGANPYWRHRKIPFVKANFERITGEFYGLSAVDIIKPMQDEVNTMHNQRMDNVSLLVNRMWKRLRGSDVRDDQLISRSGNVIDVDNMEDIMPIDMPDIPQSAFVSEEKLNMDMQRALGTPANIRGATAEGDQTATESSITAEGAQTRFGAKISIFQDKGIKRMAYLMDMNNQQFICDERAARIDPEDRNSWQSIAPDDLIGEFDYRPATSSIEAAANKALRREQLSEILGFLLQAQVPFINYQKLVKQWLQEFDIDNPEKFLIPEQQFEILKRQAIEEYTQAIATPAEQGELYTTGNSNGQGMNGHLGGSKISRPKRRAGGMTNTGTPQPQPGQMGGR